jgi:ATP-dependent DNA helicase PIF1
LLILGKIEPFVEGTGKSVLLREIIKTLGGPTSSTLGITASTGIASVNIGGTTIHSWAGIGLGQETAKNLAGKILGQQKLFKVLERWREVKSLIIDEGVHVKFYSLSCRSNNSTHDISVHD